MNAQLRNILDQLRQNFAKPANAFNEALLSFRAALVAPEGEDLRAQLAFYSAKAKVTFLLRCSGFVVVH